MSVITVDTAHEHPVDMIPKLLEIANAVLEDFEDAVRVVGKEQQKYVDRTKRVIRELKILQEGKNILLTDEQREKIINVLAEYDLETVRWDKRSLIYEICTIGSLGYKNILDEELIHYYQEYVERREIPKNKRII